MGRNLDEVRPIVVGAGWRLCPSFRCGINRSDVSGAKSSGRHIFPGGSHCDVPVDPAVGG